MVFKFITVIVLLSVLSIVNSDYLCNCYCPTSSNYVGDGTYSSSSTVCNAQNCANACVGSFSSCVLGSTWGSCRSTGNGLTVSLISLIMGLTATFVKKYL